MHTLVVYESMYGNTRRVAEAIGEGMKPDADVQVVPVREATADLVEQADLLVVGGPTHAHGMATAGTRESARKQSSTPDWPLELTLDPGAKGPGVREWLETLPAVQDKRAAVFDTRVKGPAFLTGKASSGISKGLRDHGYVLVTEPESYLIDMHNRLVDGEQERAKIWGSRLVG